jgi:hypothetical protein
MKVSEQNSTFTRAYRKSGRRLSVNDISAEARKREKEMRYAARAAEMTEEEVALEKPKGLAEKAAARKAATGQAGKDKRAAEEAKRWAATGQADKDKHVAGEAKRWAATGQAQREKPRSQIEFNPRFEFNRATHLRAAQIAPRKSRRAIAAAQFAPLSRAYTPRKFCNAHPVVPALLIPRPVVERLL